MAIGWWAVGRDRVGRLAGAAVLIGSLVAAMAPAARAASSGSIGGIVTDQAGAPIPGVCVTVYRDQELRVWPAPSGLNTWVATTDAAGRYRVGGIPIIDPITSAANNFDVFFHDCGSTVHYPIWWHQSEQEDNNSIVLFSQGTDQTNINAVMAPAGSVSGTVSDSSGNPIGGVCVAAGGDVVASSASGTYTLAVHVAKPETLMFYTWGSGCANTNFVTEYYGDTTDRANAVPISVADAGDHLHGIDAHLRTGGVITGRVIDTSGAPLADVFVNTSPGASGGGAHTDSAGRYQIPRLVTGPYRVSFQGYGLVSQWYNNKPDEASALAVPVTEGATTSGIDATIVTVPTVTSVNPSSGSSLGGTTVTLTGSHFSAATAVAFGGRPAMTFHVDSDTQISAITPPAAAGAAAVTVSSPAGTSPPGSYFVFVDPAYIESISPTTGPMAGGTQIIVKGFGLATTRSVRVGTTIVPFQVDSDTQISIVTPPHPDGPIDVSVTNDYGTSKASPRSTFVYVAPPSVSSIAPHRGSTSGATTVILSGTRLSTATDVRFGPLRATSIQVNSDTQITATAPPSSPGPEDITVTDPYGTSTTSPSDLFTYVPPPIITSITPGVGLSTGATTVVINGSRLGNVDQVLFGSTLAPAVTTVSDSQLIVAVPAHPTGTVDVTAIAQTIPSDHTPADQFSYVG